MLHLGKGDILVVYSDGLTDAQNQQGEMLGRRKLSNSSAKRLPREVMRFSRNS